MTSVDLRSSSNELSSAPNSDAEGSYPNYQSKSNTITVSTNDTTTPSTANTKTTIRQEPTPVKVRKPRKKKDSGVANPPVEKEKKPRKPRAAAGTSAASRKKVKTETTDNSQTVQNAPPVSESPATHQSGHWHLPAQSVVQDLTNEAAKFSQNGFSGGQSTITSFVQPMPTYDPTPKPAPVVPRSKPIFDPIRGVAIDRSTASAPPVPAPVIYTPPSRNTYNPSTSPAISSIINPPEPSTNNTSSSAIESVKPETIKPNSSLTAIKSVDDNAMEVDPPSTHAEKQAATDVVVTKPPPKPRAKEPPPPLPTGSGLLSSSLFGGDSGMDSKQTNEKGPSIVLHIDLKDSKNRVINFARMAEEKYGFAALYPRQAAQKERLAKVAAAGAALERAASGKGGTSASDTADEDLSVDIDRDSDNDGDVVMSGINGKGETGASGTDGPAPRKRRKRKDEYDADDPFVDDSELLWEAQAAASKDGFFVYCGPLVPEGEKATVERADGTVKRGRGRGRGGGPGSRGGRGGAASAAHGEGVSGRGGGPGSRGGGVTRKPRITKAERQQRELEKKQREQMATLAAKPPTAS